MWAQCWCGLSRGGGGYGGEGGEEEGGGGKPCARGRQFFLGLGKSKSVPPPPPSFPGLMSWSGSRCSINLRDPLILHI